MGEGVGLVHSSPLRGLWRALKTVPRASAMLPTALP